MESLVFCKISCMKYYKGAGSLAPPYNGGSFVKKYGFGHEEYNFLPRNFDIIREGYIDILEKGEFCLGFVETKARNADKNNQLHVERIIGFGDAFKSEPSVSGTTVVWCATTDLNETSVIGWYKNATVYREYRDFIDKDGYERYYNVLAAAKDCILLPSTTRHKHIWNVPSGKYTKAFGFGQSMLWYASEEKATTYLQRLSKNINEYDGENWLYVYP